MKKLILSLAVWLMVSLSAFGYSVDYVDLPFDMQNLMTSLKNTMTQTMSLVTQYQELANSVQQVKSWKQNLEGLKGATGGKINGLNSSQMGLLKNNYSNSKGSFGNYGNTQSSFDSLYGSGSLPKGTSWMDQFQKMSNEITNACNDALNMLKIAKNPEDTLKAIQESQSQSASADGAVKVGQAGNQINALSAAENVKQTALLAEMLKLDAEKQAKEEAEKKAQKKMSEEFSGGITKQTKVESKGLIKLH
jgi:P-type conjugative transfer protein TrbJ